LLKDPHSTDHRQTVAVPAHGALPIVDNRIGSHFISSVDLEEVFANVPKWQIDHRTLSRSNGPSHSEMILVGSTGVSSELLRGQVHTRGETPRGHAAIGLDMSGIHGRQFGGRQLECDEALIGFDRGELDYLHQPGFLGLNMTMPAGGLEEALQARFESKTGLAHFRSIRASRIDRGIFAESWLFFGRLMELLRESHDAASPQILRPTYLEAEIVDVMVSIIGNHLQAREFERSVSWSQRRPVVKRAEEFMRSHLAEPIMLHEICAAARASERTVEYAFREMYGMGAKKFLRVLRLNYARSCLRRADGVFSSVQDVAYAAGFWHMGHFSTNYRQLFNEAPTATMRRSHQRAAY